MLHVRHPELSTPSTGVDAIANPWYRQGHLDVTVECPTQDLQLVKDRAGPGPQDCHPPKPSALPPPSPTLNFFSFAKGLVIVSAVPDAGRVNGVRFLHSRTPFDASPFAPHTVVKCSLSSARRVPGAALGRRDPRMRSQGASPEEAQAGNHE